jgi:hypothetical protein
MMNPLLKLLLVGICVISPLLFACQDKNESTPPATKPAVEQKAPKASAPEQQQGIDKKDQEEINKIQDMIK